MSRPKYYWYGIAKKMVYRYPRLNESKPIEKIFKSAIKKQVLETLKTEDGVEKVKAIEKVCFEKSRTIEEAAEEMHYSDSTIQKWISRFINDVGKAAGF